MTASPDSLRIPVRTAGLLVIVVPYHHARWQAYAEVAAGPCALIEVTNRNDFRVLESEIGHAHYNRFTLFPDRKLSETSPRELCRAISGALDRFKPDVVCVNGYSLTVSLAGLMWCCRNRVRVVVCSESNEFDEPRTAFKEAIKRRVVRLCVSGLAGGRPQARYLQRLGLPADRVFTGYDCVDNVHFATEVEKARSQRSEIRSRYGLPARYFLACARFEEKKNHLRLIEAYARYRKIFSAKEHGPKTTDHAPWHLLLVGDGELRPQLEKRIADHALQGHMILTGSKGYDDLPAYYGLASAFIHPSSIEQWGLVVNEAMVSGLPVLVSNRSGCVQDLVQEGRNGFTFDPCDTEQLAQLMLKVSGFNFPLSAFGNASQDIISRWSPERFAEGLCQAVQAAMAQPPPQASLFDRLLLRALIFR